MNLDYVYQVKHFVQSGETLSSIDRSVVCGGKGLNQSIAMARSGAKVYHAGNVGSTDGHILLSTLVCNDVNTQFVQMQNHASGHAIIQVNQQGENCILLHGGANVTVTEEQIESVLAFFACGDWLILQNEINLLPQIIRKGKQRGLIVVLNASPVDEAGRFLPLEDVDYLFVNEEEACLLSGQSSYDKALDALCSHHKKMTIVCTLGKEGAVVRQGEYCHRAKAIPVRAVDTTGAGDTFLGFFVGALSQGHRIETAMKRALFAASLCVQKEGASSSIPYAHEVEDLIESCKTSE